MIQLSENISEYILSTFGKEFLDKYIQFIESSPKYYVRLNRYDDSDKLISSLLQYGISLEKVPSVPYAYSILKGNDVIGKTLEFALGKYYIQSLSSMIPALILSPNKEDRTLDLCAAPGSKSTQLSEIMGNHGTLYANEISINRIKSLVHNFDKINAVNAGTIQHKGEMLSKVFENYFDKILVDAPCSALGIVQKKGEVSNWWNTNQVSKIAQMQLKLLISAIKMAKVGGEIVYSTCTLTVEENELVINKVLEKYNVNILNIELPVESHKGITDYNNIQLDKRISKCRRIIPWEINSEGFFIAKIVKTAETEPTVKFNYTNKNIELLKFNNKKINTYLENISNRFGIPKNIFETYNYIIKGKDIFFVTSEWNSSNMNVFVRIGIKFGNIDKRNFAHIHTQAAQHFSKYIVKNIITIDNINDLKTYFSGGIIKSIECGQGQVIVNYKDLTLGTGVCFNNTLKSQFPRALRTGNIIFSNQ